MDYDYFITSLQEYADAPESAGVDNDFFIDAFNFVKEQQEQIKMQVCMKENEITERIKLEKENKELNKYLAETKIHLCFEEDMKKLQEENKELKQQLKDISMSGIKHTEQLTEEIKELKNFVRILKARKNAKESIIKKLLGENQELIERNKELKKHFIRVQKERNYLGDYCGGATSDEDN